MNEDKITWDPGKLDATLGTHYEIDAEPVWAGASRPKA